MASIIRNVSSNWVGFGVSIAVAFFLSPFVVHQLGDLRYGIWTLIASVTGYYGLMDLGIYGAVRQYVGRYYALGDLRGINRTVNTAFGLLGLLGILCVIISIVVAALFSSIFKIDRAIVADIKIAMVIIGFGMGIGFPMAAFGGVLTARHRFDINNAIAIFSTLLNAVLIVWVLKSGYGILGLSIVNFVTNTIGYMAQAVAAFKIVPGLRFSLRYFSVSSIKELSGFGLWIIIGRVADRVINYTDDLMIGILMPIEAIVYYAIPWNLTEYLRQLNFSLTSVFNPIAVSMHAKDNKQGLADLLIKGTFVSSILVSLISVSLAFYGGHFINLWMGSKYVSGERFTSSMTILWVLLLGRSLTMLQSTNVQVLYGMHRPGIVALFRVCEAIANPLLSIILIKSMGILGVAWGTTIPKLLISGIIMPVYVCNTVKVQLWRYFKEALSLSLVICVMHSFSLFVVGKYFSLISWSGLIMSGLIAMFFTLIGIGLLLLAIRRHHLKKDWFRLIGSMKSLQR